MNLNQDQMVRFSRIKDFELFTQNKAYYYKATQKAGWEGDYQYLENLFRDTISQAISKDT